MTTGLVIALVSCKENLQDVSQVQDQNRTEVENIARLYGLKVVNSNQLTGRAINVSSTQALRDSLKKYYIPVGTTFVRKIPVRVLPGFSTTERQRLAGLTPKQLAEELRKWSTSTEGARIGTGGAGTDLVCHNCPPDGNNPPDTDPGGGDDPGSDYPVNGEPGAPPQDNPFDPTNSSGPGMMPPNDGPGDPFVALFGNRPTDGHKWQFAPVMDGNIVLLGGSNNGRLVVGIQYNPVPGGPTGTKIAGAQVTVIAEGNMSNQVQGVPSMSRYSETDTGGMFVNDILTYSYTPTGIDTPWGGVNPSTTTFTITIQFTINPDGTISNFLIRQRMNH